MTGRREHLFARITTIYDWSIMAFGAFAPIVRFPIIGTINYVHGGRGDGLFILFLSAVIMCCALNGYRRIVAAVGIVAATVMFATVVRLLEALFTMRGSSRACNRQSVRRVGHRLRQHCRTGVGLGIPNRRRVCSGRGRSDGPQEIESIW